ncbi:MAG: EpsG family protein [Roseinatronobacter sp.]|nr:MAG: EpsG family protein [Roseinatronobacter sp.]
MIYQAIFIALTSMRVLLMKQAQMRYIAYWLTLAFLFLFSAFRWEVGCDWSGYLHQFEVQRDRSLSDALTGRDPLWWLMIGLLHRFGFTYEWMNIISSAVFFWGLHYLAKRQPDPFAVIIISFPVLIMNMPLSAMRQAAAIGLICFAISAFIDRKMTRYVIFVIIAAAIHSSAAIFLVLAPAIHLRYTALNITVTFLFAVLGAYLLLQTGSAEIAFARYVGTDIVAFGGVFRNGLLALSGLIFMLFLARRWKTEFPSDYKIISLTSLLMISVAGLNLLSTVIADRISYFLLPAQAIIFARIPYLGFRRTQSFMTVLPYLILGLFFFAWTSLSGHFRLCYTPYRTWIFGIPEF